MKRPHRPLLITTLLLVVLVTVVGIMMSTRKTVLQLPGGAALRLVDIRHGTRTSAARNSESLSTDPDGHLWEYRLDAGPNRWQERIYGLAPASLRHKLPASWRGKSTSSYITSHREAVVWEVSGPIDGNRWKLTWVDKNGFESEGHGSSFPSSSSPALRLNGATPPCHSPDVTLRVREHWEGKPLHEWPLLGELRMRNPIPTPPSTTPVMKLPMSLTKDGITVTLKSLTVDPKAVGMDRVTARLNVTPHVAPGEWLAYLSCFDERRAGVSSSSSTCQRIENDVLSKTSQCFWSDGPWLVRVSIRPATGTKPVGTKFPIEYLRFDHVPLPAADETGGAASAAYGQTGSVAGCPITLVSLKRVTSKRGAAWDVTFKRTPLPTGSEFQIFTVTDDQGRKLQASNRNSSFNSKEVTNTYRLESKDDPGVKFINIELAAMASFTFDFHVMPEFLPDKKGSN
ncbi:MAG: hypothetical protein ACAH88_12440 [Roseimicrobium sp.]